MALALHSLPVLASQSSVDVAKLELRLATGLSVPRGVLRKPDCRKDEHVKRPV